ncbi:hypothetical protein Bca4012_086113 [Brassica carinata]
MVEGFQEEASPFSVSNPSSVLDVYVSFAAKSCMSFLWLQSSLFSRVVPVGCLLLVSHPEFQFRGEVLLVRLVFQVFGCASFFGRKLVSYSRCVDRETVPLVEL